MFCHNDSYPECVLEHQFNNHCSLCVMMFCNISSFWTMAAFFQGTVKSTVVKLFVK